MKACLHGDARQLLFVALQEGVERRAGGFDAEQRVLVAAAEVGVDEQTTQATSRDGHREVGGNHTLSYTAFAARHGPNIGGCRGALQRTPRRKGSIGPIQTLLGLGSGHCLAL